MPPFPADPRRQAPTSGTARDIDRALRRANATREDARDVLMHVILALHAKPKRITVEEAAKRIEQARDTLEWAEAEIASLEHARRVHEAPFAPRAPPDIREPRARTLRRAEM